MPNAQCPCVLLIIHPPTATTCNLRCQPALLWLLYGWHHQMKSAGCITTCPSQHTPGPHPSVTHTPIAVLSSTLRLPRSCSKVAWSKVFNWPVCPHAPLPSPVLHILPFSSPTTHTYPIAMFSRQPWPHLPHPHPSLRHQSLVPDSTGCTPCLATGTPPACGAIKQKRSLMMPQTYSSCSYSNSQHRAGTMQHACGHDVF